jgi:cytochrome c oxidase subunit 4
MSNQRLAMSEPLKFLSTLGALVVLTLATVAVSFVNLSGAWHVAAGLGIACTKASLVAWFFMHLDRSQRAVRAVVIVAGFWLVVVLVLLTFSDYAARQAIPLTPGH